MASQNTLPPSVPASLDLTLDEYFGAAALIGFLSAQLEQPEPKLAADWALNVGVVMAEKARKRRVRSVNPRTRKKR